MTNSKLERSVLRLRAVATEAPDRVHSFRLSNESAEVVPDLSTVNGDDVPIIELPEARWRELDGKPILALLRALQQHGRIFDPGRTFVRALWQTVGLFDNPHTVLLVDATVFATIADEVPS